MKREITKEQAIDLFGGKAKLARALGITPGAISQWPSGELIPENREMQIKFVLKPKQYAA